MPTRSTRWQLNDLEREWPSDDAQVLMFAPLAWLKLQHLCHAGPTEVGGFGISSEHDPLYIEDFVTVLQGAGPASVEFADNAVADHFDRYADDRIAPARCGRIWIHTHPHISAEPSFVDEKTFARAFGSCDWSVMAIMSRTGETYARLRMSAGPGASIELPLRVDWASWPLVVSDADFDLRAEITRWQAEYDANVVNVSRLGSHRIVVDANEGLGSHNGAVEVHRAESDFDDPALAALLELEIERAAFEKGVDDDFFR